MISITLDKTDEFNSGSGINMDVGGYDYIIAQFVSPTGTVNFKSTNDGGAINGVTDGNDLSATNWNTLFGTNMATGVGAATVAATSMFRFSYVGRYIQFAGTSITATKVIITLSKID